ncbi:Armadillo-like helical [Metarhizium rileyi]|uniref:Armadillo-like helical n=1 Tax=Metarhizium rileyi (strain RCEF 4871) TaxID=1649241 RepID=A0A162JQK7_METRR|nr:Armadillo-like helical [Metarhizium rileyi RCEF 4871]
MAIIALLEAGDVRFHGIAFGALAELSKLSDTAITALIITHLGNKTGQVQLYIASIICKQSKLSYTAITALEVLLGNEDIRVQGRAAVALKRQSRLSDTTITARVALLEDEDNLVRSKAAYVLAQQSESSDTAIWRVEYAKWNAVDVDLASVIVLLENEEIQLDQRDVARIMREHPASGTTRQDA